MSEISEFKGYICEVTQVQNRAIKAKSDLVPEADWILPLIFGNGIKLPVPASGDKVMVFSIDALNNNRYYLPAPNLDDVNNDADDPAFLIIGSDQSPEVGVKGDTLITQLGNILDQIALITHPTAFGPTGPPINASQFTALKQQLQQISSALIKNA